MFSNKNKEIIISSIIEALRMFVHLSWKKIIAINNWFSI